ncbi:HD domain-containing protein [Halomicroarcula sp. F13]|jgi:uncharacterized protein|uniref:HD domain-containing protein n=1 Tax=Haloarcula rubra TaxID=2487747 RepID=A0AAW4PWU5_9EURY|nr:HD domain-containing protein [Halomicroarcula rubra]MBX0324747.1 HD domain-containing protein [Halomicroarcula rubra]
MTTDLGLIARRKSATYYNEALPSHDEFHANRVYGLAQYLADDIDERIDRGILSAAAWLHDIGRPYETAGEISDHVQWAADEARDLLANESVSNEKLDAIQHCIEAHGIRSSSPEPDTPEAKLLYDADKLDAIGAVGILRMACILGERSAQSGENIGVIDNPEIDERNPAAGLDIASMRARAERRLDSLYTEPGRHLASARWEFFESFISQFNTELRTTIRD